MSNSNPYLNRKTEVRCPFCSTVMETRESAYSRRSIDCIFCQRSFTVRDAQTQTVTAAEGWESTLHDETEDAEVGWVLILALALITGVGVSGCFMGRDWDGVSFLFFYGFAFLVMVLSATLIRHSISDRYVVSIVCFLLYEAIGLSRISYGVTHGMHRFTILIVMMVIGGLVFFMRSKSETGGYYGFFGGCGFHVGYGGGGGSGCSGCSGCGGGGCGGCGGCGG